MATRRPIYLLSDSQLLFSRDDDENSLMREVRRHLEASTSRAAYVGASNRDDPQFYSIFEGAMDGIGLLDRRMIRSGYSGEDRAFLSRADLILLAGGDVCHGWSVLLSSGMRDTILRRYYDGALILGVSAGAMQWRLPVRHRGL